MLTVAACAILNGTELEYCELHTASELHFVSRIYFNSYCFRSSFVARS